MRLPVQMNGEVDQVQRSIGLGRQSSDILSGMKTISVAVSQSDYEAFREAAARRNRSIAELIRDAMARYRETELESRSPLSSVPVLPGHRLIGSLPSRSQLHDEIFDAQAGVIAEGDDEGR